MPLFPLPLADPVVLKSRIVEAAIFKSGLIFVTREATIPSGGGNFRLEDVPVAIDGTFWYSSPQQIKLVDMTTSLKMVDKKTETTAKTIPDLIAANVGKKVRLRVLDNKGAAELVTGTITDVRIDGQFFTLLKGDGFLRTITINSVTELDPTGLSNRGGTTTREPQVQLTFRTENRQPATIRYVSLERGATWTGSYLVNLGPNNEGTIEGKAQIGMGGRKLENTRTTAVAGSPNIPATWRYDLASGIGSIAAYLNNTQEQAINYQLVESDPFALIPQMMQQRFQYQYGGMGGFGGGMGGGAGMGGRPGFAPAPAEIAADETYNLSNRTGSVMVESIYAYRLGTLTLNPGERLTRRMFELTTKYDNLFKAALATDGEAAVNNVLRMKNEGTEPWTEGLTMVMKDNLPLAQVSMPFTPVGETADLQLAVAKDVKVSRSTNITASNDANTPLWPNIILRKNTGESTILIYNSRDEQIDLEVIAQFQGNITSAEGGTVTQDRSVSDAFNQGSRVTYNLKLAPGERRSLKVTTETLFSVGTR